MKKKFAFVTFEDLGAKFTSYTISIAKHSGFGFNSGFYKKEGISKYARVLLMFDKSRQTVGFFFTNDEKLKGTYKIIHTNNQNSASVVVHAFFSAYTINPKEYAGKYIPKEYNESALGKIFYITLKKQKSKRS